MFSLLHTSLVLTSAAVPIVELSALRITRMAAIRQSSLLRSLKNVR